MGIQQERKCANCGIVIHWQPTLVDDRIYCCHGCAEGGPCACDYDNLPQPGAIKPIVHHSAYHSPVQPMGVGRPDSGLERGSGV
jgi:hypothetical protein